MKCRDRPTRDRNPGSKRFVGCRAGSVKFDPPRIAALTGLLHPRSPSMTTPASGMPKSFLKKGATAARLLTRAASYFAEHGIHRIERLITCTALAYRNSTMFRQAVADLAAVQRIIQPHCPWPNGHAEGFNRSLHGVWAYRRVSPAAANAKPQVHPWLHHIERVRTGIGTTPNTRVSRASWRRTSSPGSARRQHGQDRATHPGLSCFRLAAALRLVAGPGPPSRPCDLPQASPRGSAAGQPMPKPRHLPSNDTPASCR